MCACRCAERTIPIIADDYVDPAFGTGCVKITPAHDFNDYQVGLRHNLEPLSMLTLDAKINDLAPAEYQGLDRYDARKKIIADLEAQGLLVRNQAAQADGAARRPHPRGDRADAHRPVVRERWKASPSSGLEVVADGEVKFVPENWTTRLQPVAGEHPGLVHLAPAVVGPPHPRVVRRGRQYLRRAQPEEAQQAGRPGQTAHARTNDVLDTWFSSALWPFSTLGWPEQDAGTRNASCPRCWSPASTSSSSGSRAW